MHGRYEYTGDGRRGRRDRSSGKSERKRERSRSRSRDRRRDRSSERGRDRDGADRSSERGRERDGANRERHRSRSRERRPSPVKCVVVYRPAGTYGQHPCPPPCRHVVRAMSRSLSPFDASELSPYEVSGEERERKAVRYAMVLRVKGQCVYGRWSCCSLMHVHPALRVIATTIRGGGRTRRARARARARR